jgi:sodium/proline symporter
MGVSWTLIISFSVYTLAIVSVGLYSAKFASRSTSDYLLARKGLGGWVTALSASASSESGWVTLGLVGTAFNEGLAAIWVAPGCLMGYIFNWWVMARPIQKYSATHDIYTIPDMLASIYKDKAMTIRILSVIVIFFMMTTYVAAQFNAAGKAFEAVFHIRYELGVLIGVLIVVVYTVSGGFRAVAWTDFVQGLLMWMALVFLPLLVISHAGGFGQMFDTLKSYNPGLVDITSKKVGFAALGLIIGWLGIGLGYPGQPHVLIRFMAARNEKALKIGRIVAMTWGTLVFTGAVFLGLATRAVFGVLGDAEQALPIISIQLLPGVLAGLMLAAVLAAICSTADSQLLVASSSISHDIYARITGKDLDSRHVVNIDRLAVAVLGILAMILALTANRVIFSFVLYAWAGLGAAFAPPMILGFFWKKSTAQGAIAGMVIGFITVVVWKNIPSLSGALYELVPAFFISLFSVWIVSLLTYKDQKTADTQ